MKMKLTLVSILIVVISSCNVNRVYENRIEDKKEAQIVINEFYNCLVEKEFKKTFSLLSDSFYYYTDSIALLNTYNLLQDTCGSIQDTSIVAWQTFVIVGTNPMSKYSFLYAVKREKRNTKEIIDLV